MKTLQRTSLVLLAFVVSKASGAISVSFDSADSNVGAGLYDFMLSGAPATAVLADYNSAFTITGWAAPSVGNNLTLVSTLSPSAWNLTQNDSNNAKWILESTSSPNNAVDGRFEVRGKANLQGALTWQFAWPADNTYSSSGSVAISTVSEPAAYGVLSAMGLVSFIAVSGWRSSKRLYARCGSATTGGC